MLKHADILVTARAGGRLVGIARAITDYSYCTYLSDLAVDEAFQRRGIGKELIDRTHGAAGLPDHDPHPAGRPEGPGYYPHVGMTRHESCWIIPGTGAAGMIGGTSPGGMPMIMVPIHTFLVK